METKICNKCKKTKPLNRYSKDISRKSGLHHTCKDCKTQYNYRYRELNREKINRAKKVYYTNNKTKIHEYNKARLKNDLNFKISSRLRPALRHVLKDNLKKSFMFEIIGCNTLFLKKHFESLFKPGMTWDNHSYYGWHIDHIIPVCAFDLTDIEQQKECFHYTNLQPLWSWENKAKRTEDNKLEKKLKALEKEESPHE